MIFGFDFSEALELRGAKQRNTALIERQFQELYAKILIMIVFAYIKHRLKSIVIKQINALNTG